MKKILSLLFITTLSACTAVHYPNASINTQGFAVNAKASSQDQQKKNKLQQAILNMADTISPQDAQKVAHMAVYYPQVLTNQYQLISPPLLHNVLVNSGQKPRGLCINWTEDMINQTLKINPKSLDIYWGVANKGNPLREHSTLVVTAKHQPFNTGIILDPWRNSGSLFWSKVTEDARYRWKNINFYDYNRNR